MKNPWITAALVGVFTLSGMSLQAEMKKDHGERGWNAEKMQKKLDLTPEQTAKLKALRDADKETFKPLMEKQKELMKTLSSQVDAKAGDADLQTTLNDLKANREALRQQMEQAQAQKAAILTPTQQAKMLLGQKKRMHEKHDTKEDRRK